MTNEELFDIWFIKPLAKLDHNDDSFVRLMIVFPLFERYLRLQWSKKNKTQAYNAKEDRLLPFLQIELDLDCLDAKTFWNVMRNGLLHQGVPKNETGDSSEKNFRNVVGYEFHTDYGERPEFVRKNGDSDSEVIMRLDPAKFVNFVLRKVDENKHELITSEYLYPLPTVSLSAEQDVP